MEDLAPRDRALAAEPGAHAAAVLDVQERCGQALFGLACRLGRARRDRPSDPQVAADELAVWSAVDRLPVRQRVVLYLRYRGDLPYEQIGSILGISAGAARTHVATGLATWRRQLAEDEG